MKKVTHYCDFCGKEIEAPSHVSLVLYMTYPNALGINSGLHPQSFWDGVKDMCPSARKDFF